MQQIFHQFLQFLQQGIAAIFQFIQLVWTWSIDQIAQLTQVPWVQWPLWKQVLFAVFIAAMAYALFVAARQLWVAGVRVLAAFASFVGALVYTLPAILMAGVIAIGGLWVMNNVDRLPDLTAGRQDLPAKAGGPPDQTTGQGAGETTGSGR